MSHENVKNVKGCKRAISLRIKILSSALYKCCRQISCLHCRIPRYDILLNGKNEIRGSGEGREKEKETYKKHIGYGEQMPLLKNVITT